MLILASKSPRRSLLLKRICEDFSIVPSNIDETAFPLEEISLEKAKAVAEAHPDADILSADTFVEVDGTVLGKPKDAEEAFRMLTLLSGRMHAVTTYFTVMNRSRNICETAKVTTKVVFRPLEEALIRRYIESGSPLDKAGAYGIQDDAQFHLIAQVIGSTDNVIGLPVREVQELFTRLGIDTK